MEKTKLVVVLLMLDILLFDGNLQERWGTGGSYTVCSGRHVRCQRLYDHCGCKSACISL